MQVRIFRRRYSLRPLATKRGSGDPAIRPSRALPIKLVRSRKGRHYPVLLLARVIGISITPQISERFPALAKLRTTSLRTRISTGSVARPHFP